MAISSDLETSVGRPGHMTTIHTANNDRSK